MSSEDKLNTLREAVKLSPGNFPLRQLLADALLESGLPEEAEKEYCLALAMAPDNDGLRNSLALSSWQNDKRMQALVIVEDLIKKKFEDAGLYLLYAQLLMEGGDFDKARQYFTKALALKPQIDVEKNFPVLRQALLKDDYEDNQGNNAYKKQPIKQIDNPTSKDSDLEERSIPKTPPPIPVGQFSGDEDEDDEGDAPIKAEIEKPKIGFVDVGGMEKLKEQIRMKIIHPLNNASMFQAYGKKIGGGILMYGPPGCGKTHIARATAGEINAKFIAVDIIDILDKWLGNSEKNLHEVFRQARKNAPCVLFFDEVDAVAAARKDIQYGGGRHVINQFLAELDGVKDSNEGVLILAATNAPWHMDSAFKRPGRFDRIIFVPPPDQAARESILQLLLQNKPVAGIDYASIAKKTEKFSGADLKSIVDIAIEKKLEKALKTGVPEPLNTKDLEQALKQVKSSTVEWLSTAKNYALYANQGGLYDEILNYT